MKAWSDSMNENAEATRKAPTHSNSKSRVLLSTGLPKLKTQIEDKWQEELNSMGKTVNTMGTFLKSHEATVQDRLGVTETNLIHFNIGEADSRE